MSKDNEQTASKATEKKRSRLYPRYDLEKAVEFIKVVNEAGGNSVSSEILAAKMNKVKTNSTFTGRLSAAKQFGLVTLERGKISLISLAQRVLYPTSDADKKNALIEAFSTPSFYKELIDNYRGKRLSDRATLGNVVKLEYGIEAAARELAAANFISSAEYAGLVQNGILVMSAENGNTEAQEDFDDTFTPQNENGKPNKPLTLTNHNDHFYQFGGIRLYIPRNPKYDEALAKGKLSASYDELKQLAKDCDDNPPE